MEFGVPIHSERRSNPPRGVSGLPRAFIQVEHALQCLPRPGDHRLVLAAEHGLIDQCRGCRSQGQKAAALRMSRTTYCMRLQAIRRQLEETSTVRR